MALTDSWYRGLSLLGGPADRHRRRLAFQAARRHSRNVRRLRLFLPAAGTLAVLAIVLLTRAGLPDNLDLSVASMSVTRNSIIMERPHLTGFDADRREYSVTADRAVQALTNPDSVRLEAIKASVSVTGRGTTNVTAAAGDFDNSAGKLRLEGGVVVDSSDGYSVRMQGADVDFTAGTLASADPVTVIFGDSSTTGRSLSVTGGGKVIVLEGGVRSTLMPPKSNVDRPSDTPAVPQDPT